MDRLVALALIAAALQAAPSSEEDRVLLEDGRDLVGQAGGPDADAAITVRKGDRTVRVPLEEVSRIIPAAPAKEPAAPGGARLTLEHGVVVTGVLTSLADRRVQLETAHGPLSFSSAQLVRISWNPAGPQPTPEKIEEGKDAVFPATEPGTEPKPEWGRVREIDREQLTLVVGEATRKIPLASVAQVLFARAAPAPGLVRTGHFARLTLRHGDRYVGILKAVTPDSVEIFSHVLGRVTVGRPWIQSIQFVGLPRVITGNLLVCDQGGVREYDALGNNVWSYQREPGYPISARRLDNGNVLIACYNGNSVIEVRPKRTGGDVVWESPPVTNPYDAEMLPGGHVLVAAHGENAVVEIDMKTKQRVWTCMKVVQPISAQRLPSGNTLISSTIGVFEFDTNLVEKWKVTPPSFQPWRATRLDNGNTLIVESNPGRVVEISPDKKQVRVFGGLTHPVAAIRLEDGRTLVLESESNRILQAETAGASKVLLQGLNYPISLSYY